MELVPNLRKGVILQQRLLQLCRTVFLPDPAIEFLHVKRAEAAAASRVHPRIVVHHEKIRFQLRDRTDRGADISLKTGVQRTEHVWRLTVRIGELLKRRLFRGNPAVPDHRLNEYADRHSAFPERDFLFPVKFRKAVRFVGDRISLRHKRADKHGGLDDALPEHPDQICGSFLFKPRNHRGYIDHVPFHLYILFLICRLWTELR